MYATYMLILVALPQLWAYNSGPPTSACSAMEPTGHSTTAQSSATPFTITVSGADFDDSSDTLTVTISATDGGSFRGFLLQARYGSVNTASYGTFTAGSGQTTMDCFSTTATSISHNENSDKTSAVVTWTAGSTSADVTFTATIVRTQQVYWTGVTSSTITYSGAGSAMISLMTLMLSLLLTCVMQV